MKRGSFTRILKPLHHLHLFAARLLPWFHALAISSSSFFPNVPPSLFFLSLLPWHSRSSSVRLLEWMMESCVLPSNCGCHGNRARTAAFACRWGEMKLIKGGIKMGDENWKRGNREDDDGKRRAIKEKSLASIAFSQNAMFLLEARMCMSTDCPRLQSFSRLSFIHPSWFILSSYQRNLTCAN